MYTDSILKLDQLCSGEGRNLLLEQHLQHAKVYIEKGVLSGFYLPTLGEGLIVAKDETSGIELLKLRLQTKNTCVLPEGNLAGIKVLQQQNFKLVKRGARMHMGIPLNFKPQMLFSRIAGNLG